MKHMLPTLLFALVLVVASCTPRAEEVKPTPRPTRTATPEPLSSRKRRERAVIVCQNEALMQLGEQGFTTIVFRGQNAVIENDASPEAIPTNGWNGEDTVVVNSPFNSDQGTKRYVCIVTHFQDGTYELESPIVVEEP